MYYVWGKNLIYLTVNPRVFPEYNSWMLRQAHLGNTFVRVRIIWCSLIVTDVEPCTLTGRLLIHSIRYLAAVEHIGSCSFRSGVFSSCSHQTSERVKHGMMVPGRLVEVFLKLQDFLVFDRSAVSRAFNQNDAKSHPVALWIQTSGITDFTLF